MFKRSSGLLNKPTTPSGNKLALQLLEPVTTTIHKMSRSQTEVIFLMAYTLAAVSPAPTAYKKTRQRKKYYDPAFTEICQNTKKLIGCGK